MVVAFPDDSPSTVSRTQQGLVLSQGRGSGRDIDCVSYYIAKGGGSNTNYSVEEVPERFRPLDDRRGPILGVSGWSSFCLTFKALH
jgi:hypothetical protein